MALIIDASVAFKWTVDEVDSPAALALLERDESLYAPTLLLAEVANVIASKHRRGEMPAEACGQVLPTIQQLLFRLVDIEPLAERALGIALALRHPAYDCFYLALSETMNAPLITADRRLLARIAGTPHAALVRPLVA